MTVDINEFMNIINADNKEQAKKMAMASMRIGAFVLSLGLIGYVLFKWGWFLVEFALAAWFPLLLILVLGVASGIITMETANGTWKLARTGSKKMKLGIQWGIDELKKMKSERAKQKTL